MLKPIDLKVNYTKPEYAVADTEQPVFTWGCEDISGTGLSQSGYRIIVSFNDEVLWDSGRCSDTNMRAVYSGIRLPSGAVVDWKLQLYDDLGRQTRYVRSHFKTSCFDALTGDWIEPELDSQNAVVNFRKGFNIQERPERAVLYYCGLGLSKPYINGQALNDLRLQPAFTNYKKQAQYIIEPIDVSLLKQGINEVKIAVAGGWRKNYGKYLENMSSDRQIEFMGNIALWCQLVLYYKDKTKQVYSTDKSWHCAAGNITYSHLFNGEVFDETVKKKAAMLG